MSSLPALISADAEADLNDAVAWYQLVGEGVEHEFIRAFDARLAAICRNPAQYPLIHQNVRRALLRKFPYGVFYFVYDDTVVVIACFHTSRNPQDWQNRL
jgi:plasmid stabilization system protein ParE